MTEDQKRVVFDRAMEVATSEMCKGSGWSAQQTALELVATAKAVDAALRQE